jgi:hypothetical protein
VALPDPINSYHFDRGYFWGHYWRLATQPIDSQANVIAAASTKRKRGGPEGLPLLRLGELAES